MQCVAFVLCAGFASAATVSGFADFASMNQRQCSEPHKWCMTMEQWCSVMEHIQKQQEYLFLLNRKGFVTIQDIDELFIQPRTAGTGLGVCVFVCVCGLSLAPFCWLRFRLILLV